MDRDAVERFDRSEKRRRIVAVLAAVVLLLVVLWGSRLWEPLFAPNTSALCAADYRRARSARDTSFIDQRRPIIHPEDAVSPLRCGELREKGLIR